MPTEIPTEIIHIEWEGPFTLEEVAKFRTEKDYGVYQIYGGHVVYGRDALLYIGKAGRQHFGTRIGQEWWPDLDHGSRASVHVGRLAAEVTPTNEAWERHIDLAERLLIYACFPAHNMQKYLGKLDADLHNVHVLNWGQYGSLLPEVSGARWSSKYSQMPNYQEFDAEGSLPS